MARTSRCVSLESLCIFCFLRLSREPSSSSSTSLFSLSKRSANLCMAVSLLVHEVSDLCLGKPVLRSISISATVGDALSALKRLGDSYVSVWSCFDHSLKNGSETCKCVGKVCLVDVIAFLCKEENLLQPAIALRSPVSVLIPEAPLLVKHLEPHASLLEAMDLILDGAQNIVIPIRSRLSSNLRNKFLDKTPPFYATLHDNREYCWLTQEDIIRFLLNSIGLFSPTPISPINTLNAIEDLNIFAVHFDDPMLSVLPLIRQAQTHQSSVAIVDSEGKLIGEISPFTLNCCDETVVAAMATLSAGEFMAYINCGDPPEDLVRLVRDRLEERNLSTLLHWIEEESTISFSSSSSSFCSSSSDDELGSGCGRRVRAGWNSGKHARRSEAIVCYCYPRSSLVAVMIQALAHRVSSVWVIEEDGSLVGIVNFTAILKVFRERLNSMA